MHGLGKFTAVTGKCRKGQWVYGVYKEKIKNDDSDEGGSSSNHG